MIPKIILKKIAESKCFLLFCHSKPDGDAIGSLFALALMLENSGSDVHCFFETQLPECFNFLEHPTNIYYGENCLDDFTKVNGSDYLGIALDCGDEERLGSFTSGFNNLDDSIVIDHHKSHIPFGVSHWVKEDSSSTGELVYEVLAELSLPLTTAIAKSLYVAIVTDTGSFNYSSTAPRTHQIAGELLKAGVDLQEISTNLFDNWTLPRLELLKDVLATLSVSANGRIAAIYVTMEMLSLRDLTIDTTDSFVDYPRSITGVDVAIFVKESADGTFSVSLRAKGGCDVSLVAETFGGGGHANAAGCRISCGTATDVVAKAIKGVEAAL